MHSLFSTQAVSRLHWPTANECFCSAISYARYPIDHWITWNPINIVATPRAERPVFLTVTYAPAAPEPQVHPFRPDVQITVFAWEANGTPAPNVEFDWRCRTAVVIGEDG